MRMHSEAAAGNLDPVLTEAQKCKIVHLKDKSGGSLPLDLPQELELPQIPGYIFEWAKPAPSWERPWARK